MAAACSGIGSFMAADIAACFRPSARLWASAKALVAAIALGVSILHSCGSMMVSEQGARNGNLAILVDQLKHYTQALLDRPSRPGHYAEAIKKPGGVPTNSTFHVQGRKRLGQSRHRTRQTR